ncbi:alpha/beta hydrolase family protein [Aeoliella sp.]|uniref:alpha/beta hydrolase family protein n=1 Tax=Aeoliella sp. TaxID=2795800 RepID=UPI003CCB89A9
MKSPASILFALTAAFVLASASSSATYDPLKVDTAKLPEPIDLTVEDTSREREIPVRVYLPAAGGEDDSKAPVVLFSHGLGGSRMNNPYLGKHWSGRGYVVVFVQHPGSDESVWKNTRPLQRMTALRSAASGENFMLRVRDVPAVLDRLAEWNDGKNAEPEAEPLAGRMDLEHVGMSGHSFGAMTTQAVAGQAFLGRDTLTEPRIKAAVMMSPSTPRRGSARRSFGSVELPWMLLTGTHDAGAIGDQTPETRQQVYPALPAGDKYQLVLDGAEHSAFSERGLPGDRQRRNPNHHRAVLAVTTAFWDAYLKDDQAARAWLESQQVRDVLEADDQWQRK